MSIVSASVPPAKRPPSIGILGGVGAIASARFHLDLVTGWARVHDAKTDDDFPQITHISRALNLTERGMTDRRMTECGVAAFLMGYYDRNPGPIAVVCNSITPIIPRDPRFLTPVAACKRALEGVSRAWLLASESTIRDRIYQDAYPHVEWMTPKKPLTPVIQRLVAIGSYDHRWVNRLEDEIPDEETIVLGCTELSTQRSPFHWHPTISPTDEMIRILCSS